MEYGEAINAEALDRAVALARQLCSDESRPLSALAAEAVSRTFCCCVVEGEDAAEGRFSDMHRELIEAVVRRIEPVPSFENLERENRTWP